MNAYPVPAVTGVVVDRQSRVLLSRQAGGWALPQAPLEGGLDWRRSFEKTMLERAGIIVKTERLVGIYSDRSSGRLVASFLVTEFEATPAALNGEEPPEWFSADGLPAPMSPAERARIADALAFRGEVFIR